MKASCYKKDVYVVKLEMSAEEYEFLSDYLNSIAVVPSDSEHQRTWRTFIHFFNGGVFGSRTS